jgi:hypothetical protein
MTLINMIDARPDAPLPDLTLEKLIQTPDFTTAKLAEIERRLADIEARLEKLEKIAAALDKLYALEARLKALEAMIVALHNTVNSPSAAPQTPEAKVTEQTPQTSEAKITEANEAKPAEQKPQPTTTDVKELLKRLMPTEEEIERMVLRVIYRKVTYWHGRTNLKVDENGYAVIGRDVNFGVKYSKFVAIMAKYGLSDYVIARGNDNAGYYVEVKASDLSALLQRLKTLDEQLKGALSRQI